MRVGFVVGGGGRKESLAGLSPPWRPDWRQCGRHDVSEALRFFGFVLQLSVVLVELFSGVK